ncbi:hypothetical protein AVEN_133792-1 [Araneus ventricosus]|uniref:Uncharacterized protein n=1 Tax=Araneus ventricosus TaxID=182803 RepID=A0A4Y2L103_ARAVE|nr:hypothetical protein AVEN_133792-1 [Araneus ventricosus]
MAIQNSNLPPSFVNEVVKIVEDETIVRSNLKSVSDVYSWIEEYGRNRTRNGIFDLLDHMEQGLCAVDFGMKRQNSFDVSNPAGSGRIDGNPTGLKSLLRNN